MNFHDSLWNKLRTPQLNLPVASARRQCENQWFTPPPMNACINFGANNHRRAEFPSNNRSFCGNGNRMNQQENRQSHEVLRGTQRPDEPTGTRNDLSCDLSPISTLSHGINLAIEQPVLAKQQQPQQLQPVNRKVNIEVEAHHEYKQSSLNPDVSEFHLNTNYNRTSCNQRMFAGCAAASIWYSCEISRERVRVSLRMSWLPHPRQIQRYRYIRQMKWLRRHYLRQGITCVLFFLGKELLVKLFVRVHSY